MLTETDVAHRFDRKSAAVAAVQKDAATFLTDPMAEITSIIPSKRDMAIRFYEYKETFKMSEYSGKIARMLVDNNELQKWMDRIGMFLVVV